MSHVEVVSNIDFSKLNFPSHTRKILVFMEDSSIFNTLIFEDLDSKEIEFYLTNSPDQTEQKPFFVFSLDNIAEVLVTQKMGTILVIVGSSVFFKKIKAEAIACGFFESDLLFVSLGPTTEQIFCVKCYHIHPKPDENEMICPCCRTKLSISKHYSRKHDAYLGSIIL